MAGRLAGGRLDGRRRVGRGHRRDASTGRRTCGCCPCPGVAADGARPRQLTDSLPAVLPPVAPRRRGAGRRSPPATGCGSRATCSARRRRPASAAATRVPTVVYLHGGPTARASARWLPFKQVLVREGFAVLDVDFRGSTGYGRDVPARQRRRVGPRRRARLIDAARWAAGQPWSDGRLVVHGGSYGGYLALCALVDEPALWEPGIDLYGDSEIAESYRHGDRPGRLDLHRMMGDPDDPARAPASGAARRSTAPNGSRRRC